MTTIKILSQSFRLTLSLCVWLFLPTNMMGQNSDLYLYEPKETTKLDDINSIIDKENLKEVYSRNYRDFDADTLYALQNDKETIILGFCPESERIYSYSYEWTYDPSLNDEFNQFEVKENEDFPYLSKSRLYFLNIKKHLDNKYGKPSSLYLSVDGGYTINDSKILDTLDYYNIISKKCMLEIIWNNEKCRIILKYDNTLSVAHICYGYLNHHNNKLKNTEIESYLNKEKNQSIIYFSIIAALIMLVIYIAAKIYISYKKDKEEEKNRYLREVERNRILAEKQKIELQNRIEAEKKQNEENFNNYLSELVSKYGNCDKHIKLDYHNQNNRDDILVFSQTKHIVLLQKEFSFSDILDCVVNDNYKETETVQTYRNNSLATTRTDTGSMVGRSIVGGVLLGDAGAIIGGSTAKRKTVIEHGSDTSVRNKEICHNYTVAVTVKDISNPVLSLNIGDNSSLKDEIVSLIKVIMSMQ